MKKPLKIAFVVGTFPVVSQTFIVNQINALIDEGHDVKLYAYKIGEIQNIHESINKHNLLENVVYIKTGNSYLLIRFLEFLFWTIKNVFKIRWNKFFEVLNYKKHRKDALSLKLFFSSKWCLTEPDFDIIHVHFAKYAYSIARLKSILLIPEKTKLITTFHGYDVLTSKADYYNNIYKNIFKETSLFTVNTLYLKQQLNKLNPLLQNINILPVGLDTSYFSNVILNKNKETFDLVFCGRLIKLKGLELAIQITEKLILKGYENVRLHIIGDGPLLQELKLLVKEKKLEASILFKGSLTQNKVKQVFMNSDVLIMPGIPDPETGQEEAQGLVIQEAQAMQLPVVVSDVGGMQYGLLPNESGFVVKANDIDAFVRVFEQLILDENLCKQMGIKGAKFVKLNFDNEILIKRLIGLYQSVLKAES